MGLGGGGTPLWSALRVNETQLPSSYYYSFSVHQKQKIEIPFTISNFNFN